MLYVNFEGCIVSRFIVVINPDRTETRCIEIDEIVKPCSFRYLKFESIRAPILLGSRRTG